MRVICEEEALPPEGGRYSQVLVVVVVVMWHLKLPLNMEETSPNPLIQALL